MSEVERFYATIKPKFEVTTDWHKLDPRLQEAFIQGINNIISVMRYVKEQEK